MRKIEIKTSSDIEFSRDYSFEYFNKSIQRFDLISSLMSMQKISALICNQTAVNLNLEFEFYNTPKIKKRLGMLTKDFIAFTAKQVLINCEKSELKFNDLDLANTVYSYGNLEIDLHKTGDGEKTDGNEWLWLIRTANHQWPYLRFHSSIIGRYYWIFSKIFEKNGQFGKILDQTLGMAIFDAMKIGTCICSNYYPRENEKFATSFLMESYTNAPISISKTLLTEKNILKFFDIFAINQEKFKEEFKKFEITDHLLKKYEFNPLKRFPVIKTDSDKKNEQYIIPSLPDFLYGVFEGLYYVLLDKLNSDNKKILFREIGSIFESYVGELIKEYNIDILSRATLLPEITYVLGSERKSADWLLVSDEYIFQIECKKRKINNYAKAGIQSEDGKGIISLLSEIATEIDKMIEKEDHIKCNKINGIAYKGQKIINLIVFLDEMFCMNQYARKEIKKLMKSQNNNFNILGCWELELICQQSKNKQQNLYNSIQDLLTGRTEIYSVDFLDRVYHDFFDQLLKE
ncbi:MAG: hypothetical protein WCX97_04930 [Candidatus Magasanikbacteria bacterium]